ncbi:MAG: hypothetical protein V1716_03750 [Candidatus Uhrbacteria bacterium]
MFEIPAAAFAYPGLIWIPAVIVSVQFLLAFWFSLLKPAKPRKEWNPCTDDIEPRDGIIIVSSVMWLVFFVVGASWVSSDSEHWAELGVEWRITGFFLASGLTATYIKRRLVALVKLLTSLVYSGYNKAVEFKTKVTTGWTNNRKNRQERWLVSTKNARARAKLFLAELQDAIPVEFTEARMLASQMATDAVEVLIAQRKRIIHDTEALNRDIKRYKRAVEGTPESRNFATIKKGIEECQQRLRVVERKLHALILFLDEVETPIRLSVQSEAGEAAVVQLLRSYCEEHKIAMSEPAPSDPKLIEAQAEVEGCSAAEGEKKLARIRAAAAASKQSSS